jgi:DNA-binding NarL/FixJ family response regulator
MLKVLLIDDHALFRESLCRLLKGEADLQLIGDYPTVEKGLSVLESSGAELVLLDYDLGSQNGLQFLERARRQGYRGKILFVTAGMSNADVVEALNQGASGIFLKHSRPADLLKAIRAVAAGESWVDPGAVRSLVAGIQGTQSQTDLAPTLTDRERTVLSGIFDGLSNKEIAAKLEMSQGHVKAVLQRLFSKMGVRTRSQLVRIALENREALGLTLKSER